MSKKIFFLFIFLFISKQILCMQEVELQSLTIEELYETLHDDDKIELIRDRIIYGYLEDVNNILNIDKKIASNENAYFLHFATYCERLQLIPLLINLGANINQICYDNNLLIFYKKTPLEIAQENPNCDRKIITILKYKNLNLNERIHLIIKKIEEGDLENIKLILTFFSEKTENAKMIGYENTYFLHFAAYYGQFQLIPLLINFGANINQICDDDHLLFYEKTPLEIAQESPLRNPETIELIKRKIIEEETNNYIHYHSLNHKRKDNMTQYLFKIAQLGYTYSLPDLLACIKNINSQDPETGNTALHIAIENRRKDFVRILLINIANPNIKNKNNQSARDLVNLIEDESLKQEFLDLLDRYRSRNFQNTNQNTNPMQLIDQINKLEIGAEPTSYYLPPI
ncbi:MAG: ankyrin repeat domain-containing protein [Candidatus Babeliales bacterium]